MAAKKAAAKRREKTLGEALGALLGAELMFGGEEMRGVLRQAGMKEPTNVDGISFAILAKACQGDSNALRFVRDLCGGERDGSEGQGMAPDLSSLSDEELRRMAAAGE